MSNDMSPDKAFFEAFVTPNKKKRYSELLSKKAGREKIRLALDHFKDLDPRFSYKLRPSEQTPEGIWRNLKTLGAPPTCYIMSCDGNLDGREMDLLKALQEIVGIGCGALLSCIPGVLGYFESEEPGERYICHRKYSEQPATRSKALP